MQPNEVEVVFLYIAAAGVLFLLTYVLISEERLRHDVTKLRERVDALSQIENPGVSVQIDESSQRLRRSIDEAARLFNERVTSEHK